VSVLLAVTGRTAGVRYTLDREVTVVGRSSASDIQILDEAISRQHFSVRKIGATHELEDLGGQNGTLRNGVRVQGKVTLQPGDVIAAGPATFVFDPALDYLSNERGADVIIAEDDPATASSVPVRGDEGDSDDARVILEIVARALGGDDRDLAGAALEVVAKRFGAERAFVLYEEKKKRRIVASVGAGPITVSRTVVHRVLSQREGIVSGDAAQDVAFSGGVSLAAGEIRSLLAAPLVLDGKAIGMVHLDRKKIDAYDKGDLDALIPLANVMALVVLASEGITSLKKRARMRHLIEPPQVIGESDAMKRVTSLAKKAAETDATVLLTGETGSGKEVLAQLIHTESHRRESPFVAVNCGALPENLQESELFGHEKGAFTGAQSEKVGLFEAAAGGTLFLDEIGETSRAAQVKLLRALQERVIFRVGGTRPIEVDVRIIAATSRNLEDMIAKKLFREDLYFRLEVVHLEVPSLRDRPEDVPALAAHFVERIAKSAGMPKKTLSPELIEALARHSWPGNVRELSNAIERLMILSEESEISLGDLPADLLAGRAVAKAAIARAGTLAEAVAEVEREMILLALHRTNGVKSAVADALGISRVTLDAKLKAHGIHWDGRKKRSD
jgi:transcriptional regulator with PAS, ATPase and Fis domain